MNKKHLNIKFTIKGSFSKHCRDDLSRFFEGIIKFEVAKIGNKDIYSTKQIFAFIISLNVFSKNCINCVRFLFNINGCLFFKSSWLSTSTGIIWSIAMSYTSSTCDLTYYLWLQSLQMMNTDFTFIYYHVEMSFTIVFVANDCNGYCGVNFGMPLLIVHVLGSWVWSCVKILIISSSDGKGMTFMFISVLNLTKKNWKVLNQLLCIYKINLIQWWSFFCIKWMHGFL